MLGDCSRYLSVASISSRLNAMGQMSFRADWIISRNLREAPFSLSWRFVPFSWQHFDSDSKLVGALRKWLSETSSIPSNLQDRDPTISVTCSVTDLGVSTVHCIVSGETSFATRSVSIAQSICEELDRRGVCSCRPRRRIVLEPSSWCTQRCWSWEPLTYTRCEVVFFQSGL